MVGTLEYVMRKALAICLVVHGRVAARDDSAEEIEGPGADFIFCRDFAMFCEDIRRDAWA